MPPAAAAPASAPGDRASPAEPRLTLAVGPAPAARRTPAMRAAGAIALAAALYTSAFPPYDVWLAAWAVPPTLLLATRGLGAVRAALGGWLFGVAIGWSITGWLVHASLDYFDLDRLRAGVFVLGIWIASGAPYALLAGAHAALAPRVPPWARAAAGAWLWAATEVVRVVLVGNPWALLGHSQAVTPTLIQIADTGGVYAVSFLVAFVGLAAAGALAAWRRGPAAGTARRVLAVAAAALAATLAYGAHARRAHAPAPGDPGARAVVVVQGNVSNEFRWQRAFFARMAATYAGLTTAAVRADTDLVVWPENAVNFYLDREPMLLAPVASVARLTRSGLLLGAPRLADPGTAHNSVHLLAPDGAIAATYDKQRLLPFAESDPLGIRAAADEREPTYAPGRGGGVLAAGPTRLGVLICFEALFPDLARARVRDGAEVLVNVANDAWLDPGDGAAPRQHFAMAAFRAVETRRFLVRAAATGVSGFVAPTGEVVASLPANRAGTLAGRVVPRRDVTPYVRFGDAWLLVAGLALAAAARFRA
jgi:apolipoprotein N-acyltransferase